MIRRVLLVSLLVLGAAGTALQANPLTGVDSDKAQIAVAYTTGQALINAASTGDVKMVKACIATGIDVNRRYKVNYEESTALKAACGLNHADIVRLLLDAGASSQGALKYTDATYQDIIPMLLEADRAGGFDKADDYAEVLYECLSAQAYLILNKKNGYYPGASLEKAESLIRSLVNDYGAPIAWPFQSIFYGSARVESHSLCYIARSGHLELLELLLSKKLPGNVLDDALNQLIRSSSRNITTADHITCINLLLKAGAIGSFSTRMWLAFNFDTTQTQPAASEKPADDTGTATPTVEPTAAAAAA